MIEDEFAARLKQLRGQMGVSARDMSLSIGQNPGYINNIETGKSLPSMTAFFYICEYLHVTPKDFFDTSSEQPTEIQHLIDNIKKLDKNQLLHISAIVEDLSKV